MSDFHRASSKMVWLRLCRITNESNEITNCCSSLNRELRWLWNLVYINIFSAYHKLFMSGDFTCLVSCIQTVCPSLLSQCD